MEDFFAGHSHGPTPHLIDGCPLCEHLKEARNQAIEHLSEAVRLLSHLAPEGERPTIRLNIAPIDLTADDTQRCHSIDLTAKLGEVLSDAIDSVNAYAGSEPPNTVSEQVQTTVDPALVDELEQHCLGMDADFLMDLAAKDPNSAVAAFDEIFAYADYEQIMREDGGE